MEQTAASGTEQNQQPTLKDIQFEYVELLSKNNIKESDLPVDIKKKINALKPNYAKYQSTANDSFYQAMVKLDYNIVELIGDYIDRDLPDEEEYLKQKQQEEDQAKADEEAALEEAKRIASETTPPKSNDAKTDEIDMEEKIVAKINSNGANGGAKVISISDLLSIVGKNHEKQILREGKVKIHNTNLVKQFMRQEFKIG
jgi:hypothetical protein